MNIKIKIWYQIILKKIEDYKQKRINQQLLDLLRVSEKVIQNTKYEC